MEGLDQLDLEIDGLLVFLEVDGALAALVLLPAFVRGIQIGRPTHVGGDEAGELPFENGDIEPLHAGIPLDEGGAFHLDLAHLPQVHSLTRLHAQTCQRSVTTNCNKLFHIARLLTR